MIENCYERKSSQAPDSYTIRQQYSPEAKKESVNNQKEISGEGNAVVMEVNPTSHTPAHNVTAAAAPFRA